MVQYFYAFGNYPHLRDIVGTLSTFVKTAKVPNCPQLRAEPYAVVAHTTRGSNKIYFCFVERPLLWQGCAIMWQCACRKERW